MKHPLRLAGLLLLGCLLAAVPPLPAGQGGDPFPTAGGEGAFSLKLRFRFCPKGQVRPGDPRKGARPQGVTGFYLAETEVTFGQFRALLGDEAVRALVDRASRLKMPAGTVEELEKVAQGKGGDDEPVFCAGLEDVLAFCARANERLREARRKARGLDAMEEQVVRLPTWYEWQYACRAAPDLAAAAAVPHFPRPAGNRPLPAFKDLGNANQARCVEVWQKVKGLKPEDEAKTREGWEGLDDTGLQGRLVEIDQARLDNADREKLTEVLKEYFHKAYHWPPPAGTGVVLDRYPTSDATRSANAWQLRGMLDNVTEWVLWQDEKTDPLETWGKLTTAGVAAAAKEPRLFLAGGSYTSGYDQEGGLSRRTVWGGPTVQAGSPAGLAYDREDYLLGFRPGFRVVLVRRLAPDWVLARKAWYDGGRFTRDAAKQLEKARKKIEELAGDDPRPLAVLAAYEGMLRQEQTKDGAALKKASEGLLKARVIDESDKEFLDLTSGSGKRD
jgi:formylglycine-generating enzyme required for sulfatase activity